MLVVIHVRNGVKFVIQFGQGSPFRSMVAFHYSVLRSCFWYPPLRQQDDKSRAGSWHKANEATASEPPKM